MAKDAHGSYTVSDDSIYQWPFQRVGCPFCGNTEPGRLVYYPSEDEVYRLYVCLSCRRYLKAIDLRQVTRKVIPPVERIITVAMDVAAREAGYIRAFGHFAMILLCSAAV